MKTLTNDNLNSIMFNAEKIENPLAKQGFEMASDKSHCIVNTDTNEILNFCGEDYGFTHNSLIYPKLEELFKMNEKTANFSRSVENYKGSQFNVGYKFPNFKSFIGNKNDSVIAGINVGNGYDGKKPLGAMEMIYRKICENGMMGIASKLTVNSRHTISIEYAIQQLFVQAVESIENFEEQVIKFETLTKNTVIQWEDRLEDIAKIAGASTRPVYISAAKDIVRKESFELYGGVVTDFLIYNSLNNVLFDNNNNSKTIEQRIKIDQKVFNSLLVSA